MFPVLLHPDLYRRLRRCERGARARVQKILLRLRDGNWGGGARVKRLRGVTRPVYEARTDAGDRLLFTIVRSATSDRPPRLTAHLQVWDLVEHDDALRFARRNRAPEAEFLELETLEEFAISEPPPHPGATFAELAGGGESGAADPLLHFLLPVEALPPADREEISGGVRWFRLAAENLASERDFQHLLDTGGEELELKLTLDQYAVLGAPGPLLLAGSAGSGKTTIAVQRLVAALSGGDCGPSQRRGRRPALYLSYSPSLVAHARALFRDLAGAAAPGPDFGEGNFTTFGELYRSMAPREWLEHQARPMTEELFREWFQKSGRPLDPALVWEELRGILKGACLSPGRPMLDQAAYFELGRKRAPLFVEQRPEIYRIALRYQEWLREEGRSDRIDLCRKALSELRQRRGPRYDVVICDEVQDLTELEVSFVLALSARADLSGVLLAGDAQQMITPSGFRWAEVRRLAGRAARARTAPAVLRLRRNMRSSRPVVALANALLLLRREIFGRAEDDATEEAVAEGPVPVEVPAEEDEALAALAATTGFGPRCVVLTFDDDETERLRARLASSRVVHVREAKGLEFETVVLWRALSQDRDLVERFERGDPRLAREPRFDRLLRHLYVGVTRARRHLMVTEGPSPHPFWRSGRLAGLIEQETVAGLAHLFRDTASPAEWAEEGDYFEVREQFRQAAECFRRAGRPAREERAQACDLERRGDLEGALSRWLHLGDAAAQARVLLRLGRLAEAAACYHRAGREAEARACELRLLEQRREWPEAALGWEAAGMEHEAARCWRQAGDRYQAARATARATERAEDWAGAAAAWLEAAAFDEAARCFACAGDSRAAARALGRHHEARQGWALAARCYAEAGEAKGALDCQARACEEAGELERAALLWEQSGEARRALAAWTRAGDWLAVARVEETTADGPRALLGRVEELLSRDDGAAAAPLVAARLAVLRARLPQVPWFVAEAQERRAWQEHGRLRLAEHRCLALAAESAGAWSRAARHWRRAGDRGRSAAALGHRIAALSDPWRRARAWLVAGEPEKAEAALATPGALATPRTAAGTGGAPSEAGAGTLAVRAWRQEREGRWQEAAAIWRSLGRGREESRCLERAAARLAARHQAQRVAGFGSASELEVPAALSRPGGALSPTAGAAGPKSGARRR